MNDDDTGIDAAAYDAWKLSDERPAPRPSLYAGIVIYVPSMRHPPKRDALDRQFDRKAGQAK